MDTWSSTLEEGLTAATVLPRGQVSAARGAKVNSHRAAGGRRLDLPDGYERLLLGDMRENSGGQTSVMN